MTNAAPHRAALPAGLRLDARAKLGLLLGYSVALFLVGTWAGMAAAAGLLAAAMMACAVGPRQVVALGAPAYLLLAVVVACNALAGPEGLERGLFLALRMALLLWASCLLCLAATPTELTAALGSLLGPFGRFGVPVEDVALTLTLALRFIPEVGQELAQVRDAQRCRGAALDRGPLGVRARAWGALFAPVLLGLFRRGGRVAQALDARCYGLRRPGGGPQARTRLGARPFGWRDAAVLLVGWGLCAALALLA